MNFADLIIEAIALGSANAAIVVLLTKSHVFAWLRDLASAEEALLGRLLSCGYCVSWWTGGLLTVVVGAGLPDGPLLWLMTVTSSALFHSIIVDGYKGQS